MRPRRSFEVSAAHFDRDRMRISGTSEGWPSVADLP
jgi:hypothetical protein